MRRVLVASILLLACSGTDGDVPEGEVYTCPDGAEREGYPPPNGRQLTCVKKGPDGKAVPHGPLRLWYAGGKQKSVTEFKDGKRNGPDTSWHENDQKKSEATYVDDQRQGLATEWYENGQKKSEAKFEAGKEVGTVTEWHENGQKRSEATYADGVLTAPPKQWTPEGKPTGQIEWVAFPAGSFRAVQRVEGGKPSPAQTFRVGAFEISKSEVTVGQYRHCVLAGVCEAPEGGGTCNYSTHGRDELPVNCVTWPQAEAFAKWSGARLPSEAEWLYAARDGGEERMFPWGNQAPSCDVAVMDDGSGDGCGRSRTWPVCSKPRGNTKRGLCDMGGNVWEWLSEPRKRNYVFRGGSWNSVPRHLELERTRSASPKTKAPILGFRVARDSK